MTTKIVRSAVAETPRGPGLDSGRVFGPEPMKGEAYGSPR